MSTSVEVNEIPNCDFCKEFGKTEKATVDAKTMFGSWANMCESHFSSYGIGLGTGLGQRLVQKK